jgi:hypothetical protein
MGMMRILLTTICVLSLALMAISQSTGTSPDPHSIPAVDAGLGTCSVEFTIVDTAGKPVYAAKVSTRVNYGHFHKLDLEVGTNVDGKARFTGIPQNVRRGLFFEATEGDRTGNAFNDPATKCKAEFTVTIRKPAQ